MSSSIGLQCQRDQQWIVATFRRALACVAAFSIVVVMAGCSGPGIAQSVRPGLPTGLATEPLAEGPLVAWAEPGESFVIVTWGSSSCPLVADSLDVEGDDRIAVVFRPPNDEFCTADMAPTTHEFDLPDDLTRRPITVEISYTDWPDTDVLTLE